MKINTLIPSGRIARPLGVILPGAVLLLFVVIGCETKLAEEWSGFGSTEHFPPPYENDHLGYLMDNSFPLEDCQQCHGTDYNGGSSGVSCIGCHATNPDYAERCNRCHGNADGDPELPVNQAPPPDIFGNTFTDLVTVGAHGVHLTGAEYSDGVNCEDCHSVPDAWNTADHIDPSPAEVPFGGIAVREGANPGWDRETGTCSDTYCHGDFVPEWTKLDSTQAECRSCHLIPPPAPHYIASLDECVWCHSDVIDAEGNIINKALHANGAVNR